MNMSLRNLPLLVSQGCVSGEVTGGIGFLTLDSPSSLNALTLKVVRDLTSLLLHWHGSPNVVAVILQSNPGTGRSAMFSAGADLRFFRQAASAGSAELDDYFTEVGALVNLIHRFQKPIIAMMDGTTMGAGMGLAQAARLRVVTERSRLATPDVHMGFFPDTGAGWFLSRCPGHVGEFLGLTGQVITAADSVAMGLADLRLVCADIPSVMEALIDQPMRSGEQAMATIHAHAVEAGASLLAEHRASIDKHFSGASVSDIVSSLKGDNSAFAARAAIALERASPLMLSVTLEQIRRARSMELTDVLRMERGVMRQCLSVRRGQTNDCQEGIRAMLIDKDQAPRWNPAALVDVNSAMVQAFFESPWPDWAHPLRAL